VVVVYEDMHPALRPDPEAFFPNLSGPSINRELRKLTNAYADPFYTMRQRQGLSRASDTLRAKRSTLNARRSALEERLEEARLEEARAAAALEAAELEAMLKAEMEAENAAAAEKEAFNARMNNMNNLVHRQLHPKTTRGKKGKGKGKKGKARQTRRSM